MIRILALIAALALGSLAAPAAAQDAQSEAPNYPPNINIEQRMLVRCSAAFALLTNRQESGEEWALAYPLLGARGQEFFIAATSRVITEAQLADEHIEYLLRAEAEQLLEGDLLADILPVCLRLLDQSGL